MLVLKPEIESGWGEPDVYLEARLLDPSGNTLIRIGSETLFGGLFSDSSRQYSQNFSFLPEVEGEYTLLITPLTDHIEQIFIKVGKQD